MEKLAYEGKEPYLFISYAHKDSAQVLPLLEGLHSRGFRVWYDAGIEAGTEWPEYIAEHLLESGCVLAFLTENALRSVNCRQEIYLAIDENKAMLVVYLEDCALSPGMRMRLGPQQAILRQRYPDDEAFLTALTEAKLLAACRREPEPAVPAKTVEENAPSIERKEQRDSSEPAVKPKPVALSASASVPTKPTEAETLFQQAETAFAVGKYHSAVYFYRQAAALGHGDAMNMLGCCYEWGEGVAVDRAAARQWYERAIAAGSEKAKNQVASTEAVTPDAPANMDDVRSVCEQGEEAYSAANYGFALACYTTAAQQGYAPAQRALGLMLLEGQGGEPDLQVALDWLKKAAEQGEAEAQFRLGECYRRGKGVARQGKIAVEWYAKAADQAYPAGQYALGAALLMGEAGVAPKPEQAVQWLLKAAAQNYPEAMYLLGGCYSKGMGVAKDESKAVVWYDRAAHLGYVPAMEELASCYESGIGVAENRSLAMRWYSAAARAGSAQAQTALRMLL